jgi:5-methylcytosine-specific restriction endonuclease McrA
VRPVLMGGGHGKENRQLLCPTCNHRKGALSNEDFLNNQMAGKSA